LDSEYEEEVIMIEMREFHQLIVDEKKEELVEWVTETMNSGTLTVRTLYNDYLIPSVGLFECPFQEDPLCIWKEHLRTSVIRSIVEIVYPYVLKEKKKKIGKKIILACPEREYHELPLRIVSDWFELNGFSTIFAGGNTPRSSLLKAVEYEKADYVALSVSNPYNLCRIREMIDEIKNVKQTVKIIVGGIAFENNPRFLEKLSVDFYLKDLAAIDRFSEEIRG